MVETVLNATLLAALVVAVLVACLAWRWPFPTLAAFLLWLLVHEAALRFLRGPLALPLEIVTSVSRMRMVALIAMLLVFLVRQVQAVWRTRRLPRPNAVDVLMGIVLLIGCAAALLSPDRMAGIAALRNYFQPVAVFYLARGFRPTQEQLRRLLIAWVALGVLIAAFGLYQWVAWGEAEYAGNGYLLAGGELDAAYLRVEGAPPRVRPPSTLTGPNEFGLQMAFLLLATIPWATRLRGRARWLLWEASALLLVGLF